MVGSFCILLAKVKIQLTISYIITNAQDGVVVDPKRLVNLRQMVGMTVVTPFCPFLLPDDCKGGKPDGLLMF